jgi:hypothetical protein
MAEDLATRAEGAKAAADARREIRTVLNILEELFVCCFVRCVERFVLKLGGWRAFWIFFSVLQAALNTVALSHT